jgi:hypothetical protein
MNLPIWVTVIVSATALALGAGQQPSGCKSQVPAEQHICEIQRTLPAASELRFWLDGGRRGAGMRMPWMDEMRSLGVKQVFIEAQFVWHKRPQDVSIVRSIYFTRYEEPDTQIIDPQRVQQIRARLTDLEDFVLKDIQKSGWFFEVPENAEGRRGLAYVTVFDHEWLPADKPILQPFDPRRTPLEQASIFGDEVGVISALVMQRWDQERLDRALGAAAGGPTDKTNIIRRLIKAGANVNENAYGDTPLVMAVRDGKHKTVTILLELGAKNDVKTFRGETPLSIAKNKRRTDILQLLLQPGNRK